jgi:hypothetical protein
LPAHASGAPVGLATAKTKAPAVRQALYNSLNQRPKQGRRGFYLAVVSAGTPTTTKKPGPEAAASFNLFHRRYPVAQLRFGSWGDVNLNRYG